MNNWRVVVINLIEEKIISLLQLMAESSQKLIGEHDFRNFCKLDVSNGVVSCRRKILSVDIMVVEQG